MDNNCKEYIKATNGEAKFTAHINGGTYDCIKYVEQHIDMQYIIAKILTILYSLNVVLIKGNIENIITILAMTFT